MIDLFAELYEKIERTSESWRTVEAMHLTAVFEDGHEQIFICPHIAGNMFTIMERFLEHISSQENIMGLSAGCVWFLSGNIMRFEPNELIERFLGETGHWEFIELPRNPKDFDDLNDPTVGWIKLAFPELNKR